MWPGPSTFGAIARRWKNFAASRSSARPDLKAAVQAVDKAQTDHRLAVANGSDRPDLRHGRGAQSADSGLLRLQRDYSPAYLRPESRREGAHASSTSRRNERLRDAAEAQVFSDVDSAYATLNRTSSLLAALQGEYLQRAVSVRDTVSFSYQHGGASLLDFLNAQNEYRSVH